MSHILEQNKVGTASLLLLDNAGTPITGLTYSDVSAAITKNLGILSPKTLNAPVDATVDIGSGANGTVTVTWPAAIGNTRTIEVIPAAGAQPLSVGILGSAIIVDLSDVDGNNTATLVAAEITSSITDATGTASGTGSDTLSFAEGPTFLTGGADSNFGEAFDGYYFLTLDAADTDTLGSLGLFVTGATIRTALEGFQIVESFESATSPGVGTPNTTSIYGYVYEIDGTPKAGAGVSARTLNSPSIVSPGTEGMAVSTDIVTAISDSTGFFALTLLTGSQVDITVASVNYRRTITVPADSINLFEIP